MARALVRRVERGAPRLVAEMADAGASVGAPDAAVLLSLLLETVETGELPTDAAFDPVRRSATASAGEGVDLEAFLGGQAAALAVAWEAVRAAATKDERVSLPDVAGAVLRFAGAADGVAAASFMAERLRLAASAQAAEWALVDAFLAGRPTADAAARAGRQLAGAYGVLLLSGRVPRDHLRGFEAAVAALGGGEALWRLTAAGANVLVPVSPDDATEWMAGSDVLVAELSAAAGDAALVASVAWGEGADGVARAGDEAVQVLRLVAGLDRPQGVYRLDDVLLEAALSGTAAGPAARLAAILAPLERRSGRDQGGELLSTLEAYLANDADRRRTAAALHVHPNTLDYRLRRIGELTGSSPTTPRGLQVLGAALTLRRVGRGLAATRAVGER